MATYRIRFQLWWYKLLIKLKLKTDEVYYIGGSEALPPPLTKDEEEVLLKNSHQEMKQHVHC